MEKTDYALRLESLMKERHWDASTTAKRLRISSVAIHKVLEKRGKFGVESLFSAARIFNVSAYWLHTGEGERGSWVQSGGSAGLKSTEAQAQGDHALSQKALALGLMYDTAPEDEAVRAMLFRRASAALLGFETPSSNPKSAALAPAETPKI